MFSTTQKSGQTSDSKPGAVSLRRRAALSVVLAASLGAMLPGAASAAPLQLTETGSSLLYPLFNLWVPAWTAEHPGVRINTAATGSGAGIAQSIEGIAHFGASDAYLSNAQMQQHPEMLNIPVAISSQMVNYNVPGLNDKRLKLSSAVLAGMYDGSIRYWDDAQIKVANAGVELPHQAVVAIHRADSSGDTFMFTQYLSSANPGWDKSVGYGTTVSWPAAPGAIGATGNAGLYSTLETTPYSIGYIGVSYRAQTEKAGLGEAMLENRAGKFVALGAKTVSAAAAMVPKTPPDQRISMIYAPGDDAYPIINYEYVIVRTRQPKAEIAKQARNFLTWAVSVDGGNAPKYLEAVQFLPLPDDVRKQALAQIAKIR